MPLCTAEVSPPGVYVTYPVLALAKYHKLQELGMTPFPETTVGGLLGNITELSPFTLTTPLSKAVEEERIAKS
jgi:hypothetical protein